jgi:site-specific recombinase XerD
MAKGRAVSGPTPMVARVEAYLAVRRALGFQLRVEGGELLRFARYADTSGHRGPVTVELALRWAQTAEGTTRLYRARRLETVRCFARHQVMLEPATEIPPARILGPAHRRTQPHIYSHAQILLLLELAARLPSRKGLRARTYVSILSLLACSGLRISEALRLRLEDVDLNTGVLTIRETKFHKSRLVPLHSSARIALQSYVARRDGIQPRCPGATLFISEAGRKLAYTTMRMVFRGLVDQAGVGAPGQRRPRLQDLRHTFACERLLRWCREGVDVHKRIAALSTYLGHAKVSDTYWYLTGVPELMAITGSRFERFAHERRPQ